jgi:tRNA (guanosine-2'-O-)-methyltransferase
MGELKDFLASFLMPQRLARIRDVLSKRTNHITVVLEDIYDPHNASAVLRSCDAMGIQTVHIIQKRHTFQVKEGVSMGTGRWLDLRMHKETSECFDELRKNGYLVASASPPLPGTVLLPDFQSPGKTAIVLGSEKDGLSPFARENSDCLITIPMFGFAECLNLIRVPGCHHYVHYPRRDHTLGHRAFTMSIVSGKWKTGLSVLGQVQSVMLPYRANP